MYMLVKYDDFVFRIARQLNYKRTLTSATTARIDLAGFPYEAFEQGGKIIRILHECESGIEKSVPRITDDHGDHAGRIFLSHTHTNNGFFFLLTTEYLILYWKNLKKAFQKILNSLRCDVMTS